MKKNKRIKWSLILTCILLGCQIMKIDNKSIQGYWKFRSKIDSYDSYNVVNFTGNEAKYYFGLIGYMKYNYEIVNQKLFLYHMDKNGIKDYTNSPFVIKFIQSNTILLEDDDHNIDTLKRVLSKEGELFIEKKEKRIIRDEKIKMNK